MRAIKLNNIAIKQATNLHVYPLGGWTVQHLTVAEANQIYNVIREQANPSKVAVFLPLPNKVGRDDVGRKSKYLNVGGKRCPIYDRRAGKAKKYTYHIIYMLSDGKRKELLVFFSGKLSVAIYPRHGFT